MGAESGGGDDGESHSNNRLRKRTTKVARTRDESDEESRGSEDEDEEEWEHLQKSMPKQKNKLDLGSNESHPVHAPFFPEVCVVQLCEMVSVSCFSCFTGEARGLVVVYGRKAEPNNGHHATESHHT